MSKLNRLMTEALPTISFQKRLSYRTSLTEVRSLFKILNKELFNGELPIPKFQLVYRWKGYWGECSAKDDTPAAARSTCIITLVDKWVCRQWLITILAHEMCHQYQWDVAGLRRIQQGLEPIMSHGPSFFVHRDRLTMHSIPLKRSPNLGNWFKFQNLFKS